MKAYYYGSKKKGFTVLITANMQLIGGTEFVVANKAQAKKIAKAHNAQPWNF